jgi:hypothetical protein
VWAKLAVSSPATASATTPAAYRQRASKANRAAAT